MGQQQLLLLVLGIVIVGIAVVAGIQAFSEGKDKADRDAATSDAMRVISDLQAWKLKPQAFGGGASTAAADFTVGTPATSATNIFSRLGLPATSGKYNTSAACISAVPSTSGVVLTVAKPGTSAAACGTTIATVTVSGTGQNDIAWSYGSAT